MTLIDIKVIFLAIAFLWCYNWFTGYESYTRTILNVDEKWYDSYMNSRNTTVRCSIVDGNDNILGLVSLTGIDYIHRSATLHIMIGSKQNRGKGLGFFAVKEIVNHAFNRLNLNRIELGVLESNLIAQNLYKKCGFVIEGVKRKAIYKNGAYLDLVCMSVLKEEFSL